MQVSVDSGDFGAKVYLDGRFLEYCISADDEKGEAVVYKRHDGDYVVSGDSLEIETIHGNIRIEKPC